MLIKFSQITKQYQKPVLGLIIISMVLIMSQISIHALMFQEKMNPLEFSSQLNTSSSDNQHCTSQFPQDISQQCQSFLSLDGSLSANSTLWLDISDIPVLDYFTPLTQQPPNPLSHQQLSTNNLIIKLLFPSLFIKLHFFLI